MKIKKILSLILIGAITVTCLTGCGTKTALEPNDFVDLIEQNGYKTTNVKGIFFS